MVVCLKLYRPEKRLWCFISSVLPFPETLATTDLFPISVISSLPECLIHVNFSDGLLPLSNKHLGFIHVFAWLHCSLLFTTEYFSIVWMYHGLLIHSPIEGQLACLPRLAITNKAAVSIHRQVFVCS